MADSGADILDRICASTREETARRKTALPLEKVRQAAAAREDTPRGFGRALKDRTSEGHFALITEIKRASPSLGLIRPDFDPMALARAYEQGGATCLSVLTEGPNFQGSERDLIEARGASTLPVLRKDFILDPWQVFESRAMGADCILLIMAALTDDLARELEETARALDVDVLVEVHDERELERALGLQTQLIGINNRDLKTLATDLATTERLAPLVPPDRYLIAESGVRHHDDLKRLARAGALSFLVGESLMRQPDVAAATHALRDGDAIPSSAAA